MAVFASVARLGSFAAAARELGVTRAAVSHQIRRLEAQLDVPLTHRSTRSLSLTTAGEVFAERCARMVVEADAGLAGIDLIRREPKGRVRLTCSHDFGRRRILPALVHFRQRFPGVQLDIEMSDRVLDLVAEGIDLAVRGGPLPNSSLKARLLLKVDMLLCAAPSYVARRGKPGDIASLVDHDWVIYPRTLRRVTIHRGGTSQHIGVKGPVATNDAAARSALVLAGVGLARMPAYAALPALAAEQLVRILPECSTPSLRIHLVHPDTIGPSARLLADHLVAAICG